MLTYTVVVKLSNYRSWTESLGYDREWKIQLTQSRIYQDLQALSKELNGFTFPMRYDVQIILLPQDVDIDSFIKRFYDVTANWPPVGAEVEVRCGLPHEVLGNDGEGRRCLHKEVCIAHLDLNNFTTKSIHTGFYRPYVEVLNMCSRLALNLTGKALVQYLGGDNVVVVTCPQNLEEVLNAVVSYDVKVGVGVSEHPRRAFELAAKALSILRMERKNFKYLVIKE